MAWPSNIAQVDARRYRTGRRSNTEPTRLDDGAVRHEERFTYAPRSIEIVVLLANDAAQATFDNWAVDEAGTYFAWTDPVSGQDLTVTVNGGAGGIAYQSIVSASGRRSWEASLTLVE